MGGKSELNAKVAEKPAAKKSATKTAGDKKSVEKSQEKKSKSKKPVAGIDETGTFRAWDNAKTKATPKKVEEKTPVKRGTTAEQAAKNLAHAKSIDPSLKNDGKKLAAYDDSQIKHLDALEHIRLRSGMYIGRLGDGSNQNDGIYVLLKEIIDNSIDEFIVGFGERIDIQIMDNRVKVRDYGRGIPLGKVVECVSQINTGAKYNDDVFQFSVGMNGVGTKAVNALSSFFKVIAIRDGHATEAIFERGKLISEKKNIKLPKPMKNGTYFEFVPDEEIFGKYSFNMEFVERRLWNYAYLNTGLKLSLNGQIFESQNGLLDLLQKELDSDTIYPIGSYTGAHLQFAFSHTNAYGENYFSFVNGQYTSDGGTHLAAFKEGFIKGVNEFFQENYKSEDIREGITAAVLVKVKDPIFESQTKNKLGNTDIRAWIVGEVQSGLDDWLHKNPKAAEMLQKKIEANEKLRTELSLVKKEAKEAAKKVSIRIPKLDDCRFHLEDGTKGENSMIFITEGNSASGVMTHSRDANFQAIFSLRGKPENMYGKKQTDIYKNDELYQLMMALGIETSVENLKYSKIVIATDADNDGFHIRNLVLTFFLGYFEELVTNGRVWILETPLFRVRTKKENIYCYSELERDKAQQKLGKNCETSRFKGLGEINPSEFRQFIDPETMHLTPVEVSQLKLIPELLAFYMGKNTPERRSFIEQHLLSNSEIDV
ncbi:toprim domain-containing protein [Treponema pectinovorum]|uniref:toprim domain-containing protein n=1 Tax=Treponema pectinovorum TaxID=164 RepID=UPI0011CC2A71|nr:toprim domain-containing protein [Treponema pectinovorum]